MTSVRRHRRYTKLPVCTCVVGREASSELQKAERGVDVGWRIDFHLHLASGLQEVFGALPGDKIQGADSVGMKQFLAVSLGEAHGLKEKFRGAAGKYQEVPVAPPSC